MPGEISFQEIIDMSYLPKYFIEEETHYNLKNLHYNYQLV